MQYLTQEILSFTTSNITESTRAWNATTLTAGSFIVGVSYTIVTLGTTDFILIGAATNTVGLVFTATGVGVGTGTATTTYVAGQFALLGTYIYKSVATNLNKSPDLNVGIFWVKWAISNRWAMLDLSAQSKSFVNSGNIVVTFPQNRMKTLTIGNYEADTILIEILDIDGITILWSYLVPSSINTNVIDYYSYIYEPYGYEVDRGIKIDLPLWGESIRVTFNKSTEATRSACGFLVGGSPVDMGKTLSQVNFKFRSYAVKKFDDFGTLSVLKRSVQDLVDFNTNIPVNEVSSMRRKVKAIYNDIIVFIVDEDVNSIHENMLTLGMIENADVVISDEDISTLSWSVFEAI